MKLLFMSDLHTDINEEILGRSILMDIATFIKKKNPDRVIIAGDISGDAKKSIETIDFLEKETHIPLGCVPGNHDIWVPSKSGSKASWRYYNLLLKHSSSLISNPIHFGDYVVVGGMSWYDYSFGADNVFDKTLFERKKGKFWDDAKFAKWDMNDKFLCEKNLKEIEKSLEKFKDYKVIFVNHFIPYEAFLTIKYSDNDWNFCNAYMGSHSLGELIDRYSNVEYVIFGHTHKRYGIVEYKNKKIICNPLGYVGEWGDYESVDEQLEKASVIIEK